MKSFRNIIIISVLVINTAFTQEANAMRNFLDFPAQNNNIIELEEVIHNIEANYFYEFFDPSTTRDALYQKHGPLGLLMAEWSLNRNQGKIISLIKRLENDRALVHLSSYDIILNYDKRTVLKKLLELQTDLESKVFEIHALLSQYSDQ